MNFNLNNYINKYTEASTLAFFRLAFGLMMVLSIIRFISYGWVEKLYIAPKFHFSFYGFEWVKPLGNFTYLLFLICGLSAFFVALGYKYRMAIIVFFLSFTYIELLDKTTYLNHYYFISIISFLLVFLPANASFSIDAFKNKNLVFQKIPSWNLDILKLMLGVVYFYAGLAKLNSDWLINAMPLSIWLPGNANLPLIGSMLEKTWAHYSFSWIGALYDLAIPFLLLYRRTRVFAFVMVVIFHILTRILFPIGMFPYIMIVSSLIFFDSSLHLLFFKKIASVLKFSVEYFENGKTKIQNYNGLYKTKMAFLIGFMVFQLAFPFRYLLYPQELFWTEEGYRFSWRVMLMEKAGYANFIITDSKTKNSFQVNNSQFLTTFQEKQMAFQPDFILEYAHYLHDYYSKQGISNPEVRVESYVALNGRLSQPYINSTINLIQEHESFKHKTWILPFNDEIKGF